MTFGERFLEFPDLFPARQSGKHWGTQAVSLNFVGGPYSFLGLAESQTISIRKRFGDLCGSVDDKTKQGVTTRLFEAARGEFKSIELKGWNYDLELAHHSESVHVAGLGFLSRLEWEGGLSGGLWTAFTDGPDFQSAFENYLRILVAYRLLDFEGALLHSAGIHHDGSVHIFYGFSGAGKSTISRLGYADGQSILSDDLNPIFMIAGQAMSAALPFWGDLKLEALASTPRPMRTLSRLQKGDGASWSAMSRAQGVATLLTCSPYVNSDPYRRDHLQSNLESIIGLIPVGGLTFSKNSSFNEIVSCIPVNR